MRTATTSCAKRFRRLALVLLGTACLATAGCGLLQFSTLLVVVPLLSGEEEEQGTEPTSPLISGVAPSTGSVAGGESVQVFGKRFQDGCSVRFGGTAAPSVTFVSGSQLTVTTPPSGTAGATDVTVSNPDGQECTLAGGYVYHTWWDDGWAYRKPLVITGSTAGELTAFQVELDIAYDPHMKSDFTDLRFTQLSGVSETELSFWLEEDSPGVSATAWVRVASIAAHPAETTIYVYYGNPGASSASDFDATFTKDYGDDGLLARYSMDGGTGTTLADGSGNGLDGTMSGFASPEGWVGADGGQWAGRPDVGFSTGDSLRFDGTEDHVDCGSPAAFDVTNALTLEAWVKGDTKTVCGREQVIVSKWQIDGAGFTNTARWEAYDPGANGVGTDPDGYIGAAFDGQYVYFVPFFNGTEHHCEVLRYDTRADFSSTTSWDTFNPNASGVGTNPRGYYGALFDGTCVYFVPRSRASSSYHGECLCLDTSGVFGGTSAWSAFDPGANGVGVDLDGFMGGAFDGQHIYFAPRFNGAMYFGEIPRFDTAEVFDATASWESYDPASNSVGTNPRGFSGACFADSYVYFCPNIRGADVRHGEVLRFRTDGAFSAAGSWEAYDAGANGVGTDPDGYEGAAFDGRFIYFSPFTNQAGGGNQHGEVLRYDTWADFSTATSWATYDAGNNGVGTDPDGFTGAVFDGRYVYFVPCNDGVEAHGEFLRFDSTATFSSATSWSTFDPGQNGIGIDPDGFRGGVYDGRYLYFSPHSNGTEAHGEVLRYDTVSLDSSFKMSFSCSDQSGAFSGAPFGITGTVNTSAGAFSVSHNADLPSGDWHHVALTYNGSLLSLYVDASLVKSSPASGTVCASTAPVEVGRFHDSKCTFDGDLDEVRIYSRALSQGELRAHYERRKFADPAPLPGAWGAEETR